MRYALNVAPLNGWETLFGFGQADAALSATGDGVKWFFFYGDAGMSLSADAAGLLATLGTGQADQALTATASELIWKIGEGQADINLTADAYGYAEIHLTAEASDMVLNATGSGYGAFFAVGEPAAMILSGLGIGYSELRGFGQADAAMSGSGTPYVVMRQTGAGNLALNAEDHSRKNLAILGKGQSDMIASGLAGIPHPHVRPSIYMEAEHKRILTEGEEDRTLDVRDELIMKPLRERRPLIVAKRDRSV